MEFASIPARECIHAAVHRLHVQLATAAIDGGLLPDGGMAARGHLLEGRACLLIVRAIFSQYVPHVIQRVVQKQPSGIPAYLLRVLLEI